MVVRYQRGWSMYEINIKMELCRGRSRNDLREQMAGHGTLAKKRLTRDMTSYVVIRNKTGIALFPSLSKLMTDFV